MLKHVLELWKDFRKYLVTGLMVWVPLIITVWVSWMVVDKVSIGLENLFGKIFVRFHLRYSTGLGLMCAIAIFLATGFIARYWIGRKVISIGEGILEKIPFISRIYSAVRQISEVFMARNGTIFQSVCLIEYPRPGMTTVAFITCTDQGLVQETAEKELISVFVPTTPNPTSGFLLYLTRDQITPLDMKIEEAMKLIVSAGAYLPSQHAIGPDELDEKEKCAEIKKSDKAGKESK